MSGTSWDNMPWDNRRPENVPEMPGNDCPVCMEALFDDQGIAQKGEVAKIRCIHWVHSDCLANAGRALNADGQRYGVGGAGIRAGCPICNQPVSMWLAFNEAAAFPVFWMARIQACLEEMGPEEGGVPVPVSRVQEALNNDPGLTKEQKKKYLYREQEKFGTISMMDENGFNGALKDGSQVYVSEVINGGPEKGGSFRAYFKDGAWDYDDTNKTLWLHKWGPKP